MQVGCCAGSASEKGDPWGSCWNSLSAFTGASVLEIVPPAKETNPCPFIFPSLQQLHNFFFYFLFAFVWLCVPSLVFFSIMQTHTSFLLPTFLLVPVCLWLPAHLDMQALSSFHGKPQEFCNLFSCVMHSMCNFVPFLSDCLCHTYFSHNFSPTNNTFSCSTYTYQFMLLPTLPKKFLLLLLCWQWSTAISGVILVLLLTKRTPAVHLSVTGSLFTWFFGVETGMSYPHG